MCASTLRTRQVVETRGTGRQVAASLRSTANCFLSLPVLSAAVPITSIIDADDAQWLRIASLCTELVSDDELALTESITAREIVEQAFSVWASKHCAECRLLDSFEFDVSMDPYSYNLEYSNQEESRTKSFFVGLRSCQNTPHLSVNEKIELLERQYPGLGRTALVIAEQASYRTLTALTPNVGHYLGQNLYWYGMDNDEDFIEEMESDDAETREILMPSDFISAFPSYFFEGELLQRDALQTIANAGDEFGETAKVILSMMDLIDLDAALPDFGNFEGESVYFACYMGVGGEPDVMGRLIDDFYESTSYGDCFTDLYGIAEVQFDKHSFLKWRDEMEKGFALYSKLDCLMQRISNDQF